MKRYMLPIFALGALYSVESNQCQSWCEDELQGSQEFRCSSMQCEDCALCQAEILASLTLRGDTGEEQVQLLTPAWGRDCYEVHSERTLSKSADRVTVTLPKGKSLVLDFLNDNGVARDVRLDSLTFDGVNALHCTTLPQRWKEWQCPLDPHWELSKMAFHPTEPMDRSGWWFRHATRCYSIQTGKFAWNGMYILRSCVTSDVAIPKFCDAGTSNGIVSCLACTTARLVLRGRSGSEHVRLLVPSADSDCHHVHREWNLSTSPEEVIMDLPRGKELALEFLNDDGPRDVFLDSLTFDGEDVLNCTVAPAKGKEFRCPEFPMPKPRKKSFQDIYVGDDSVDDKGWKWAQARRCNSVRSGSFAWSGKYLLQACASEYTEVSVPKLCSHNDDDDVDDLNDSIIADGACRALTLLSFLLPWML
eukprot:gnl/MRDRNA2_/MRDRNA2_83738_c0_seq1.p1 gnl/MRDRNA2_/MRDRNA2_83738_c0~~gnl/MRDRNA2_/MRDRNA2_83738_c0_seq1.p1  ORF type:complete len:419 (-),score=61.21 gnl/MRDRNA2_/MRDRNA2_83738_c0_seq1:242-1498(-)